MRVTYDQEVDVLRIVLSESAVEESDEEKPGVVIDYDRGRQRRWLGGARGLETHGESNGVRVRRNRLTR